MRNSVAEYLFFLIVTMGCAQQKSNTEIVSKGREEVRKTLDDTQLRNLKDKSSENIDRISVNGDTLDIISSGDLIYRPFGFAPFKDSLQHHHNGIFNVKLIFVNENYKEYRLSYKESFIDVIETDSASIPEGAEHLAEYHHTKPDHASVRSGNIQSPDIILINSIHVGMKKNDFFLRIFNGRIDAFDNINTVINGDAPGEHATQYFLFKEDTLSVIKFEYMN